MHRLLPFFLLVLTGCAPFQGYLYDVGVASERERAGLRARAVEVEGRAVRYYERPGAGAEAPTIVLLHGFGGSKDHWIRFAPHLPARYRVLALDLPGHGDDAPDPDASYTVDVLAAGIWATVDRRRRHD